MYYTLLHSWEDFKVLVVAKVYGKPYKIKGLNRELFRYKDDYEGIHFIVDVKTGIALAQGKTLADLDAMASERREEIFAAYEANKIPNIYSDIKTVTEAERIFTELIEKAKSAAN